MKHLKRAKAIVSNPNLPQKLMQIFSQYQELATLVKKFEDTTFTISDAHTELMDLKFTLYLHYLYGHFSLLQKSEIF